MIFCGVAYASITVDCAARLARPEVYLVLEDFGVRAGCAWRETDEQDTDLETVIRQLISGDYTYPVRIVTFNAIEGWSRTHVDVAMPSLNASRYRRRSAGCTASLHRRELDEGV